MANMSYCRFQNTLSDLRDCYENLNGNNLSKSESQARLELVDLCRNIADEFEDSDDDDEPTAA